MRDFGSTSTAKASTGNETGNEPHKKLLLTVGRPTWGRLEAPPLGLNLGDLERHLSGHGARKVTGGWPAHEVEKCGCAAYDSGAGGTTS